MAGLFALTRGRACRRALALVSLLLALPVHAAPANAAPAKPVPPKPAPAKPAPAKPAVPEDYFQRYGKILQPGTEPAHPLKLALPVFDIGQVKIPSQEEMNMREKLERLATLSDEDIRQDLEKWPAFSKMSLADEGMMFMRIQQFKDRRARFAQERAHALGLLTLKPNEFDRFEKEYWDKRLQMDRELSKQFEPVFKARESQIEEQLYREFSTPGKSVPPPPAPAVKPAPPTPPAPGAKSSTPPKPTPNAKPAAPKPSSPPAPAMQMR